MTKAKQKFYALDITYPHEPSGYSLTGVLYNREEELRCW